MPRSRPFTLLFAAVLLAHGVILLGLIVGAFDTLPAASEISDIDVVVVLGLVCFWAVLVVWPAYSRPIAAITAVLAASALLTPGAVAVVCLMLLNTYLVGARLLALLGHEDDDSVALPASVAMLVGVCAWIGLMSVTSAMKLHYAPVYAAALLLPICVWWRQTLSVLNSLRQQLNRPVAVPRGTERVWISLLLTVVLLHLFVVAKPDVGYDANAIHLQFARLFAEYQRWRFDVTRYAWAVMPLGADYAYAAVYILGGEYAARLLNFAFGALACLVAYQLICRYARREVALISVCLLASTPLAFLETGSLFVENLWLAFLLGALLLVLDFAARPSAAKVAAIALLCAGALQTKVIGLFWVAPLALAVGYLACRRRVPGAHATRRRALLLVLLAVLFAAWPYANAWMRTGNPVFPFFNDVFHSPYFDSERAFVNPLFVVSLRPWSIYEIFLSSGRFSEGWDGAAGFQWLLLLPLIIFSFLRRRPRAQWLCLALAAFFFVAVFTQQAYLRYLLPVLLLLTVLGGWALSDLPWTRALRVALLAVGGTLCLLNLHFMPAANSSNATLCLDCVLDRQARADYVAIYLPDRAIADFLNATLPTARIGFFMLNRPGASGYTGYSRAANWHDFEVFKGLTAAHSAEDVRTVARRYELNFAVFLEPVGVATDPPTRALRAYREKYTTTVWNYAGLVVTLIKPER